jgi:EpsI family protein
MTATAPSTRIVILSGVLVVLSLWTRSQPADGGPANPPSFESIPWTVGPWSGEPAPPLDAETARVVAADQYLHRYYTDRDTAVEMDVAYYRRPRVGAAMHSPLNCLPGTGWQVLRAQTTSMRTSQPSVDVRRLLVGRGGRRIALTYWFQNRSGVMASEYEQRFQLLLDAARRRATDAALVRVMSAAHDSSSEADRAVLAFSERLIPVVQRYFE